MKLLVHKTVIRMINDSLTPEERVKMSATLTNKAIQITADTTHNKINDIKKEMKRAKYLKLAQILRNNIDANSKDFKIYIDNIHC